MSHNEPSSKKLTSKRLEVATKYIVAWIALHVATWIRMLVDPILSDRHPFVTYILAIIFIAWCCGMWPALLALVCGYFAATYFFATPRGSSSIDGLDMEVGLILYIVVGLSSILFVELKQIANRRAESIANQLEEKQTDLEMEVQRRKLVEGEQNKLLRRFVSLQEEERGRISRELHDHCAQEIIALQLGIKRVGNLVSMENTEELSECFLEVSELLTRLSGAIHDLAFDLRPPLLDELGLHTAIRNLTEIWSQRVQIAVDFECRNWNEQWLNAEASLALYRVLQEALNNVAKHSGSKCVSILLENQGCSAVVIIEDHGVGFDMELPIPSGTTRLPLGIRGMRERLLSVGGSLEIESAFGKGTTLFARVPTRTIEG